MMEELVSNSSSGIEIIAAFITLIAAFITLIGNFISNKSFINQDGGSHIGYSLTNSKQQSQHVRSKAFKLTRVYMYLIISNIILYYFCTEILSVLVEEIKIGSIIGGAIGSTIGSTIGWLYFFIWFATLLYVLVQSDVGRIIFEDIKKIKTREKIEDRFFKLIYGYSFGFISYILFIELCAWIMKHIDYRSLKESLCLLKSPWFYIVLFLLLVFLFLLLVFLFFSKKSKGNHRKTILTDFTKLKLILHYCMALNPLALCISLDWLDMKSLNKDLQLNMDFLENILRLGIVVAINLVVVIIVYRISDRFYSRMMNTAFLYYNDNDYNDNDGKRYIYRKIDNQFLCGNQDYLQYDREPFDDELRKIKEQIKKKKWDKKVRHELEKEIDRLKPYSVYIKIEDAKEEFNKLNTCIDEYDDREKKGIVKTIRGVVTKEEILITIIKVIVTIVVWAIIIIPVLVAILVIMPVTILRKRKYIVTDSNESINTIRDEVDNMIKNFEQKKIAVKLLPEDELKNYTIYPIIDMERNRFF